MDYVLPFIGTLGIGGFLGWAAAQFVKTTSRLVGCGIGLVFILMQVLAYYGIAEWHWDHIVKVAAPAGEAAKGGAALLWKILTYNLPFTGGFGTGFWLGMRR